MLRPVVVLSALLALVIPASAGAAAGPAGKADAAQAQYGVPDQGQVLPETASGGSGTPGGP
ncbi:MAG: hypothetical protein QOE86_1670, partial [Solirubrobacteraceae bacterium]|nr:hypothetical protein [Solirubrobacteraceae bacterium]